MLPPSVVQALFHSCCSSRRSPTVNGRVRPSLRVLTRDRVTWLLPKDQSPWCPRDQLSRVNSWLGA